MRVERGSAAEVVHEQLDGVVAHHLDGEDVVRAVGLLAKCPAQHGILGDMPAQIFCVTLAAQHAEAVAELGHPHAVVGIDPLHLLGVDAAHVAEMAVAVHRAGRGLAGIVRHMRQHLRLRDGGEGGQGDGGKGPNQVVYKRFISPTF